MFNKVWQVAGLTAGVVIVELFTFIMIPFFKSMGDVIKLDPCTGNYVFYRAAGQAFPLWVIFIPLLVGGIGIVMVLAKKPRVGGG